MLARHCFQLIARFLGLWLANENASIISAECAGILQSGAKFLTSAVQTHFDRRQGNGKKISNLIVRHSISVVQQ